ncbi:alpha/beta hydrolase family protein [Egicoccus halophilus]|uniref:Acyl-CoA thioester hydrolase n=1 Tax=Egicoccus halophilus TaxID=1670830 RepID=A0A8J3EU32_9ACTN|nr:alpha/beta fold hydrolase [Egicoccus halophilus]GGI06310.1 acyl-CoA thioester hydrolase [Egicoccus halophilus]
MRSRELTFVVDGLTLHATLTLPDRDDRSPAALLIPGSGQVDRDSDHRKLPLGVTRELATALAEAGIASLRFDKRGVGASEGDFLTASFDDSRADARAALAALRDQPDVDRERVLLVGHSEGAVHAASLAAEDGGLVGVVLLAGTATTGAEVLRWQGRQILPTLPAPVRGLLRLLRQDPANAQEKLFAKLRASDAAVQRVQGARINAAWMRGFLDHDAASDLARITAPVLALTGSKDLQANPADLPRMAALVAAPIEVLELPDLNHILRHTAGAPSLGYKRQVRSQPLDPRVTAHVTRWAAERVGQPA